MRKEAGAGAGNCEIEGAGDEGFQTLEGFEEGLRGGEWGVNFVGQWCVFRRLEMLEGLFPTGLTTWSCLDEPRRCG